MIDPRTVMYEEGRRNALDLAARAPEMDGTAIIAEEDHIPAWSKKADYTGQPKGIPVSDEGQVWLLLIPHRAGDYIGRPSTLRSLWGLAHTKDPAKAKPWMVSYGTSGLYMKDECCTENGGTYRSKQDNNPYSPSEYPQWWEEVVV